MSKREFEDLLKKYEQKPLEKEIDWKKQKQEWLDFIKMFYRSIESWLAPYKQAGKLSYAYQKTQLNEEYIGTYDVDVMIVDFAGQKLTLEPIGTLLIGTKGRIDMEGSRGRVQFILADKNSKGVKINTSISRDGGAKAEAEEVRTPDWAWKIVLREPRKIAFVDFTENNFFDAVMEAVNG